MWLATVAMRRLRTPRRAGPAGSRRDAPAVLARLLRPAADGVLHRWPPPTTGRAIGLTIGLGDKVVVFPSGLG